jgi:hypothetical protein
MIQHQKIAKLIIVLDSVSFVAKFCIVAIKSRRKKGIFCCRYLNFKKYLPTK